MAAARKTVDERKGILAQQITNRVAMGMRVETQSDYQAVLVKGRPINHVLHLILTLVTVGFWGVVWAIRFSWAAKGEKSSTSTNGAIHKSAACSSGVNRYFQHQ